MLSWLFSFIDIEYGGQTIIKTISMSIDRIHHDIKTVQSYSDSIVLQEIFITSVISNIIEGKSSYIITPD